MNILFLTSSTIETVEKPGIYTDLMREFRKHGHEIYAVSTGEERGNSTVTEENHVHILHSDINNNRGSNNIIKKGIGMLTLEKKLLSAVKKAFGGTEFQLVIYATPPISFLETVKYIKKRDNAATYLLLKDIFPQNAVDIGLMRKSGVKGIIYKYFRKEEKALYAVSDRIGCMSEANVRYLLRHNPEISPEKAEVCPNSIEVTDISLSDAEKREMREKYGIPQDKKVFVYGGNLGKPQGIPFIINCIRECRDNDAFFLIVGGGSEYGKIEEFVRSENPENLMLMKRLPREDYDRMIASCDVGLIFLDRRFTIPNFPSRLLSYMQAGLPVFACTDPNTDIGKVVCDGGFGWQCESSSEKDFRNTVEKICGTENFADMIEAEKKYLRENYTVEKAYSIIMKETL